MSSGSQRAANAGTVSMLLGNHETSGLSTATGERCVPKRLAPLASCPSTRLPQQHTCALTRSMAQLPPPPATITSKLRDPATGVGTIRATSVPSPIRPVEEYRQQTPS